MVTSSHLPRSPIKEVFTCPDCEKVHVTFWDNVKKIYSQEEWQYIVDILITDCEYEIAITNGRKINFYDFLNKYQTVLDSYSIDSIYKSILNDRIKFIRYKI